jgi:hypothetical protein
MLPSILTLLAEGAAVGAGDADASRVRRPGRRQAVWEDPADAQMSVSLASSSRLRKLRATHTQDTVDGERSALN